MVTPAIANPRLRGRVADFLRVATAQLAGEPDRGGDDDDVDDGERGNRLGIAGFIEVVDRDGERDGTRAEQEDGGTEFLDRRHEDEQPAGKQSRADQRQGDLAHGQAPRGAENARAFLERGVYLAQRCVRGAYAERYVA